MDASENKHTHEHGSGTGIPRSLIILGARTGGPAALTQIIPRLPQDIPASVLIMQQMRPGFTALLAEHLSTISEIPVREAVNNQRLATGEALIVPGGFGCVVVKHETFGGKSYHIQVEDVSDSLEKSRYIIDHGMRSAAEVFGALTVGVILTGLGDDGVVGLKAVRSAGGKTIVQDEATSILFDMPKAAIAAGVADEIIPLYTIADRITELVGENYASLLQEAAG